MVGFSFLVSDGPDQGRTFVLHPGITIIGRLDAPSSDDPRGAERWTLTDPAISRTHAQITWDGYEAPVLVHLSTTNATLLNGRIVTGQSLEQGQSLGHGHHLRLGQTTLEVQQIASSPGWRVREGDSELAFDDPNWEEQGVSWTSQGSKAQVQLTADAEAYLLRRLSGVLWSTPLRRDVAVPLEAGDILRLESRRMEILSAEG